MRLLRCSVILERALGDAEWVPPQGIAEDDAWRSCPDARWLIGEAIRRRVEHRHLVAAMIECIRRGELDEGIGPIIPEELGRAVTLYLEGGSRRALEPWVSLVDELDASLPGGWTKDLAERHRRWLGEPAPGRGLFWAVVVPPFARILRDQRNADRLGATPILGALAAERADIAMRRARAAALREVHALVQSGTSTGTQVYGPEAFTEIADAVFLRSLREMSDDIRRHITLDSLSKS
jgi:hypothetical protein